MSKSADAQKMEILKFIQSKKVLKINEMLGRDIPYEEYDDKILTKPEYYKHKKDPSCVEVQLIEKLCKIPQYYTLSNLPVLSEKRSMQDYHFTYTDEQLKNMYKTPKIIVDVFCSSFSSNLGIMNRTSFFAVAPNAQSDIPCLYRFSIAISQSNPKHYSISLHGIVGGKEDGWLFLGRLDNAKDPHIIDDDKIDDYSPKELKAYYKELKAHNAVKKPLFTASQQATREEFHVRRDEPLPYRDCILCPHMHKPSTKYKLGEDIERCLPKFMRNCFYNDFDENVAYMMKIFNIYNHPHFRRKDAFLVDIIKKERRITTLNREVEAAKIVDELFQYAQLEKTVKEARVGQKESHDNSRNEKCVKKAKNQNNNPKNMKSSKKDKKPNKNKGVGNKKDHNRRKIFTYIQEKNNALYLK